MRNLKRALSLALASVMLLGMMVVGTSAASYPDVDENDNVEAIEVLNAVKVMIGDRGNFRPDAAVNRHEMATIMAKLVLGVETADNYVGSHPFTDVFPWADKYVAACYENGLVAGTSATTFGGNQPLTAVQAAAMMLRALGYKDLSKGANDWRAPVTAMANQIRLFNGVASNPSEQLNRNQVAQLALNTLKSPMVNLKDNTISWTDGDGQIIMTGGGREYIALSSNEAYARAINDTEKAGTSASQISGWTVELGEHLYNGKLKLNNNYLDVFGRPSRKWEFDGKAIGSYIKEELMVMDNVGKVTGNDLYTLLGASTIKDYEIRTTVDGIGSDRNDAKTVLGWVSTSEPGAYFDASDMNRNNKKEVGATGTGVLTQVFVDHEKDEVYVAVINTYLALASRDYDEKAEQATLTVYGIDDSRNNKDYVKTAKKYEAMTVQNEDFDLVKDVKKDDPYLVTVADGEIQTMVPDEVLEAVTLSAFKLNDHVVSGGTEYKYTTTATYNIGDLDAYTGNGKENLKDITYNIYLDAYGNLIGIKEIDAVKNYVFLAGIDLDGSNLYNKTATANALFLDGTSKTIKINMAKSKWTAHEDTLGTTSVNISGHALLNTWCTYSVNGDLYTVNEVHNTNPTASKASLAQHHQYTTDYADPTNFVTKDSKVNVKYMRLNGGGNNNDGYSWVYGDSDSVYLIAELDELLDDHYANTSYAVISGVDSVTTGIADASITVWSRDEARKQADDTKNKWTIPGNSKLDPSDLPADTGRGENSAEYWISHGIYTLYDDEGIVIAAVIVGENEGVKDLVYVHSGGLDLESYADGTWTWTRKVIYKGEEITLTEKGDAVSDLKDMLQYHWYEIKRNANGEIINAEPAYSALGSNFVVDYTLINSTVETGGDTVLYQTNDGPVKADDTNLHTHTGINNTLKVIGNNTLAVETLSGSGIHFRDNVNVVLQYWNQNTKQTEVKTGTGVDDLKSMVDFVNDNNPNRGNDLYWLSAVIEKGFATTIVIYDSYNNYDRPEQNVRYVEMPSTSTIADVNKALIDNNVKIMGAWQPNDLVNESGDRLNTVRIPANRTLWIDGNFIAYQNGNTTKANIYVTPASSSTSKLIVSDDAYLAGQQLDCNIEVGRDLKIRTTPDTAGITYLNADFTVGRDMIVEGGSGKNVRVTSGSNVVVKGNLSSKVAGVIFTIYGHMEIGNDSYDGITTFPIHYEVLSSSTLKAGTLYGTFCVGFDKTAGRVVVNDLRTTAATGAHTVGANLNRGTLEITGTNYTEAFNIGDDAEARIVFGDKAADKAGVFLTEDNTQANVAGKTYIFTEKNGVITVTDANKNLVDTIEGGVVDEIVDEGASEGEPGTPGDPDVKVESVELDKTTLTLKKGETGTLKATVKPENAGDKTVTWKSSDETVATVDANGKVTAVAKGTATITVTTKDGGKTATCAVTVTEDGEVPSGSETIQAVVTMSNTGALSAKIYGYLQGSPITLTPEQIAGALNKETNPLTGEKFSVTAADVNLAEKKVTVDGETITLNNVIVTPVEALYKVTYPGGSTYLKAGVVNQKLTGVTAGVTHLIPSTTVVDKPTTSSGSVIAVDTAKSEAVVAAAPTADVTYATALPLGFDTAANGDIMNTTKGVINVSYDDAGTPTPLASSTGATPTHYIQSGKSLTFKTPETQSTDVAANKQVKLTINGTDYAFVADKGGKLTERSIAITGVATTSKKVDITAVVEAAQIPVTFDGKTVQTYKVDDAWKCMITLPTGVTKLAYVKPDKTLAEVTLTNGQYTVADANIVDGKITLVSAYEVKGVAASGTPSSRLYQALNDAGTDVDAEEVILDTGVLVDANATTKVYLKAEAAKTVLALKSGSKSTISKTVVAPGVAGDASTAKGIWEITVGGNLDIANDVEIVAQVDATPANVKAELKANITKDEKTPAVTLNGITIKGDWKVSGNPVVAPKVDGETFTVSDVTVTDGEISLMVTMTEGTDKTQPTDTSTVEVGNIIVTLTDGTSSWRVVVPFTLVKS